MPEKALKKLNDWILPQWKVCFFASMLVGLIAHIYKIINWIPNWDSLVFRHDAQNMIGLGRWFLPVVCSFSSFYDLPFLCGFTAIVYHGLGAVVITRILNVKKNITAALIGAIIVVFPTVTSSLMYNYVVDGYSVAFFLSVLAAYYMTREKPKVILPAVMIALSSGIYQAYITVTIMLVLLKLIDEIIFDGKDAVSVLKKSAVMLLTGILGMGLYAVVLKIMLGVLSAELLEYQGISSSAGMSGLDIFASLYVVKETFLGCFFDMSEGVNTYVALNAVIFALTVVAYVYCFVKSRLYKKPLEAVLLIVLTVMLFFGAGALAFVNPQVDYHSLMLMGYSVFYLFFIILYERGEEKPVKCWSVLALTTALIFNCIVIANVSYHKAQMAYERSLGVLNRIADRIERTNGAKDAEKILVLGALENSKDYSVMLAPEITGITDGYIIRSDDEIVGQSVLASALADYCELQYSFVSGEEKDRIASTELVEAMDVWPAEGSVAVIEDTVVIKLGTEGEK